MLILAPDEAEVAVIATRGQGFANPDLEVVFLVVPVPDVAAVDADDDRCLRERLAFARTTVNATRLLAAEVGIVAGSDLVGSVSFRGKTTIYCVSSWFQIYKML